MNGRAFLVPGLLSLCGLIAFTAVGVYVWRHAPGTPLSPSAGSADDTGCPRSFWREVVKMYCFPLAMFVLAIVPGLNFFTYSGHGGLGWFFAPLCFPWVIGRLLNKIARGPAEASNWYKNFLRVTIPSYIAISLPLSWAAATSIRLTLGLPLSTGAFFLLMVSPFPWWYFT